MTDSTPGDSETRDGYVDDTEQSECTVMDCSGEAEYAYWMPDLGHFSEVRSPEHDLLEDGDLAPYVCESCRNRMASGPHWDADRFVNPREKLVADGGIERPDPTDDPRACSKCGVHIGFGGDEYCDGCARDVGAKPPLAQCMSCGQQAPQEQMEPVDVSPEDEYYPDVRYLCWRCSGGDSA